jgi:hypothetical protein
VLATQQGRDARDAFAADDGHLYRSTRLRGAHERKYAAGGKVHELRRLPRLGDVHSGVERHLHEMRPDEGELLRVESGEKQIA